MSSREIINYLKKMDVHLSLKEFRIIKEQLQTDGIPISDETLLIILQTHRELSGKKEPEYQAILKLANELGNLNGIIDSDREYQEQLEQIAKKQGFSSFYEMQLYEDVCCGRTPEMINGSDMIRIGNVIFEVQPISKQHTKEELEKVINHFGLEELLTQVQELSIPNRIIQIYLWNRNAYVTLDRLLKAAKKQKKEASEIFDGEKEEEIMNFIQKIERQMDSYAITFKYLDKRTLKLTETEKAQVYKVYESLPEENTQK